MDKVREGMQERGIKVVKAHERLDALTKGASKIVASEQASCGMIPAEELREKFMELRRAYRSFEKFVTVDCGIEI